MLKMETIKRGNASIILTGHESELRDILLNSPEAGEEMKGGRGAVRVIELSSGDKVVKRHFRHGGLLRNILGDLFAGPSRSLKEFLLTLHARQLGAPVPRVLASITERYFGVFYRGDIVTEMLPSCTLGQLLDQESVSDFRPLLKLLLDLHRSGVEHIDLNINNILVPNDRQVKWMVIDLDGGKLHRVLPIEKRLKSILRLERSYQKKFGVAGPVSFMRRYRIWHHYLVQSGLDPKNFKDVLRQEKNKRRWHQILWPTN